MNNTSIMFVVKRDGSSEKIQFDKITDRLNKLIRKDEKEFLDSLLIAQKVIQSIYSGISTEELDIESAKICMNMGTINPLYGNLAGRILVSNLHKKTTNNFTETMATIQIETNNNGKELLNSEWLSWVTENKEEINNMVDYNRDYDLDFFGFKTLERAYLIRNAKSGNIYERPQDMFMRVASFINKGDLVNTKSTYDYLSTKSYTHASPTLFNSGTNRPQLSSCFLLGTDDSLSGITQTWDRVSQISKWGGGIGVHVSNIRAKDSIIRGTNGPSSGIIPMLQVYNNIARYVNQGGKRKGSFAIYLETHHPDILDFLEIRKNFGPETERARDLFTALWISDLFMEHVQNDGDWYLFCPDEAPGLNECYGDEYRELYNKYVTEGKFRKVIKARKLMEKIFDSQIETGTPYMLYKDSINKKSNQKNIGIIKSSNLCAEIVEYSDDKEHAVCNLASIAINKGLVPFKNRAQWTIYTKKDCNYCIWAKRYLSNKNYKFTEIEPTQDEMIDLKVQINGKNDCEGDSCSINKFTFPQIFYGKKHIGGFNQLLCFTADKYNFDTLWKIAYTAANNLDKVIDVNYYPTREAEVSNKKHRPIGLGIQGVADTLARMKINFESQEAVDFNERMMETIYHGALSASNDRANELGHPYETYEGSPISKGQYQFDLWNVQPKYCNWDELKEKIKIHGVHNSLVTALMPTASTSQIMGNTECFEWFTNNIYTRRTLAGDFILVNKHLINDLISIGEWSEIIKQIIIADDGSIQKISSIPKILKDLYKTIWEIKQIWVLKQAKARGPFVDQTQSMNIFMPVPDYKKLNSCHMWGWKNGLKTGMYYLRTKAAKGAIKFTIDPNLQKKLEQNDEPCDNCSA
jgi:ribonucleoside-diphosphate reductase alpha subunit